MSLLIALTALMLTPVVQPAKPLPNPSEAANGDFRGKMLIVADVEKFWAVWEKPEPPSIDTVGEIRRGGKVTAIVVFAVCKPAADGKCSVSATFSMTGPDGKTYAEAATSKAWTEAPAPGFNLLASLAAMTFELEPTDKLGPYRMIATMTDEVAGKSFTVSDTVTAVAD